MNESARPDLILGLVGPVGVDLDTVGNEFQTAFGRVGYHTETIRLSALIEQAADATGIQAIGEERYDRLMRLGTELRRRTGDGGLAAGLAIGAAREIRRRLESENEGRRNPVAMIFRQLKHDDEVSLLREVYGSRFVLVAVTASRNERVERLIRHLSLAGIAEPRANAEALLARDKAEQGERLGQQVRRVFPEADLFIDISREPLQGRSEFTNPINRAVELLFGHPFHTPTKDELAMFHAHATSLRSAAPGRQVGASIVDSSGELIATGANEVPKAGGGQYWAEDVTDARDFQLGENVADQINRQLLRELLSNLHDQEWLRDDLLGRSAEEVLDLAMEEGGPAESSKVLDLLEFGRDVHAEMAALMSAARRGVPVEGATLYTTTFPCHTCARHIVAAGIDRVVYREPYPKSRVPELYPDSITIDEPRGENRVPFVPFVGIAPRMFQLLFEAEERKTPTGELMTWTPQDASPRLAETDLTDEVVSGREEVVYNDVLDNLEAASTGGSQAGHDGAT